MFVCDSCHLESFGTLGSRRHLTESYGPCEMCGVTRGCSNCRCELPPRSDYGA